MFNDWGHVGSFSTNNRPTFCFVDFIAVHHVHHLFIK